MESRNRKIFKVIRIILALVVTIVAILFIVHLFPYIMDLSTKEGQIAFKEKVDSLGFKGGLLLFTLEVLQILLVVLPGEPLEVLAGMCYGAIGGTIFITFSVFITTVIIYFAISKFGKKFIYNFFSKEKIDKIESSKLFKDPKRVELLMCILFFIPGTPKDLLVYIGALLPIKPWRFIMISTFVRFPSVISSTIAGSGISKGNLWVTLLAYIITFVIAGVIIWIITKNDKDKSTEEIVNILK